MTTNPKPAKQTLATAGSDAPDRASTRTSSRRGALALASMTLAASVACAGTARAQTKNIDVPKFEPAPAGDRFFGVPSPYVPGELAFHGGVVLDYAHDPLVLVDGDGNAIGSIVEHQLFLNLNVAMALANRFELSANLPIALLNEGEPSVATKDGSSTFNGPDGPAVGDLRVGMRLRLHGGAYDAFQFGLGGYLWLPFASPNAYVGSGLRAQAQVLVGGRVDRLVYAAMVGPTFRPSLDVAGVEIGPQFNWGGGIGVLLGASRQLQLGAETTGAVSFGDPGKHNTNAELLFGVKYRPIGPLELGAGAGPGIAAGVGTPDVRAVFNVFYTPEIPKPTLDADGDGILDTVDACPKEKGERQDDTKKNGCPRRDRDHDGITDDADACVDVAGIESATPEQNGCPPPPPPPDTDGDGVLDVVDACPRDPGPLNDDPKKSGCPLPKDADGDGIIDEVDACPNVAGVSTSDPKTHGCPPDTDGDGFRDDVDACPKEKGADDPDPTKRGCPTLVRVTDSEIIILEQVQFDTGKARIKPVSNPLLDSVAQVLKEHAEILKLEVQGHTDSDGNPTLNQSLSTDRATAVLDALVARGIDRTRLVAKGYGQTVPIAPNDTPEHKQKNRRVQFVVKEKKSPSP